MNRWKLALFFAVFIGLNPSAPGKTLKVAFNKWEPWKIYKDKGYGGIDARIIKEVAKRMKMNVEFMKCPWQRCLKNLKNGSADILTSVVRNEERENYMLYIEPSYHIEAKTVFYINKDSPHKIAQYEDLLKVSIGTTRGYRYFDKFDRDSTLKKYEIKNDTDGFRMLSKKRFETFVSPEISGDYIIRQSGLSGTFRKASYFENKKMPIYITLSKKSEWASKEKEFSRVVQEIVSDGIIEKIILEVNTSS